jgi:uncharacterized protein
MGEVTRPFYIMAKPVCGICNLDCRYCYYTMKPGELYPGVERFMMPDEVLDRYTREYLEAMPVQANFGWQGGEPLLAGKDFFRRAVELQKEHGRDGQQVANALQTNGTLLDEEWAEFLAEYKFLVGLSLDGPAEWHDCFRKDHQGNGSFHRAWAGLELLRKHGVEFNVLVTLNSRNAPHAGDIYRYFTNRGIHWLQFIPILEKDEQGRPREFSCSGEQFGRFMLDVFELWAQRDVGVVSERLIDSVLHTVVHGEAAMCCNSARCANAHVLEWNGDFYACDHFVYPEWLIGNIMDTPLVELATSPRLEEFARLKTELPAACRDCEFLAYCQGGCPKHHIPDAAGLDPARVNHFCEGYKMFFREALPEIERIAEYVRRGQAPPRPAAAQAGSAGGMATGPAPAEVPAPGRNQPCPCGSGRKYKHCCGRK